jgi:hypothetical protein
VRHTLKSRLTRLEKQSVSPKVEVLWVNVDRGQTHERVIKAKYAIRYRRMWNQLRCRENLRKFLTADGGGLFLVLPKIIDRRFYVLCAFTSVTNKYIALSA